MNDLLCLSDVKQWEEKALALNFLDGLHLMYESHGIDRPEFKKTAYRLAEIRDWGNRLWDEYRIEQKRNNVLEMELLQQKHKVEKLEAEIKKLTEVLNYQ